MHAHCNIYEYPDIFCGSATDAWQSHSFDFLLLKIEKPQ